MRTVAIVMIVLALAGVGVIVYAQLQNMPRRTPTLTTDDVAPRPTLPSATPSKPIEPVSGSIAWEHSISRAKELARSEGKLIIVDVYTDWCGWCKKMDQVIYSDPKIVGLSRQEVFLKIDAEDGGQGEQFSEEMNVRGYPTTIILDSNGNRITQKAGFIQSADGFIQFVESARTRKRSY